VSGVLRLMTITSSVALMLMLCAVATAGEIRAASSKSCAGTYRSTSVYSKARVIAIRGVGCREAKRVARRFDHGMSTGRWRCGLAHGGGRRLFSCGHPPQSGDIRDWRYALEARGVGPRR
jgi:hypothetical protein